MRCIIEAILLVDITLFNYTRLSDEGIEVTILHFLLPRRYPLAMYTHASCHFLFIEYSRDLNMNFKFEKIELCEDYEVNYHLS